jgi:hypothetical protein
LLLLRISLIKYECKYILDENFRGTLKRILPTLKGINLPIFSQSFINKAINQKVKGIIQNNNKNVILFESSGFKDVKIGTSGVE